MAVTVRQKDELLDALNRLLNQAKESCDESSECSSASDELTTALVESCDTITERAESASSGFVNVLTCLMAKVVDGQVDCRYHRPPGDNMPISPSGDDAYFVGRQISEDVIAPWLRDQDFVHARSGWQTRTYERPRPYTLDYPENIKPAVFKAAFLQVLNAVQDGDAEVEDVVQYILEKQVQRRDAQQITISVPSIDTIEIICRQLRKHFSHEYSQSGVSRLPVLALYALYEIMSTEQERYKGSELCPLESHSSADSSSGAIGDIEIKTDGEPVEGVEVKYQIQISKDIVEIAYQKIRDHQITRYYILTTSETCVAPADELEINDRIAAIRNTHGCQVIVNGVLPTIRYGLRFVQDPSHFFKYYAQLLNVDEAIAYEHRQAWNVIIEQG
jgi:DNA (cytosine-5)-methyltransferase 1